MGKGTTQTVYLFNCDSTFKLDSVEMLLLAMNGKYKLNIEKLYFRLNQIVEICETTIPRLQMDMAVFVVHAHESRLSINEDDAGIGYAKIYRALLDATGNKVFIVIGGDDNYKDEEEKAKFVISRWARGKVASQFDEEYLDGRKSFIFSWSDSHRAIHVEALLHFLDTNKSGQKFEYLPKSEPVTLPAVIDNERKESEPVTSSAVIDNERKREDSVKTPDNDNESGTDGQKGTSQDEEPNGKESDTATRDYPAGMVLLETCMRYGKISYLPLDVVQRKNGWRPSTKNESDLMQRHKQTPEATVRFSSDGNAAINCVVKDVAPFWRRFRISVWFPQLRFPQLRFPQLRPFLYGIFLLCGFWGLIRCIRVLRPRFWPLFFGLNIQTQSSK